MIEYDYLLNLKPKAYILETKDFPTIDKLNNNYSDEDLQLFRDTITKHIMENGSVFAHFSVENELSYRDKNLYSTCDNINKNPHGMSVIGWDDNYSKEHFKDQDGNMPEHDGAYIVVNSWGEMSFGNDINDKGFMYVSHGII